MTRTFLHEFRPLQDSPVAGPDVQLTVQEIEDAGLREVLQTPGAAFGSWAFLETLLQPGTPFVFREPLGQAREVKVALSGLFGRFVARAYLQRYFGLSIFAHLGRQTIVLDGGRQIKIVRCARGDLPDWVACTPSLSNLTVAEAKGCHDPSGPARALDRAWKQAERVDVVVRGRRVTIKRLAIATRWGVSTEDGLREPWLSVHDPIDEGDPLEPDDKGAIFTGLFRHHVANIISALGHEELAASLRDLTSERVERGRRQAAQRARSLLDTAPVEGLHRSAGDLEIGSLIGGLVTRAGPLTDASVSRADHEVLARLDLRPVFVGVERELVHAAVDGDPSSIRGALTDRPTVGGTARGDRAGSWIIPRGDEAAAHS